MPTPSDFTPALFSQLFKASPAPLPLRALSLICRCCAVLVVVASSSSWRLRRCVCVVTSSSSRLRRRVLIVASSSWRLRRCILVVASSSSGRGRHSAAAVYSSTDLKHKYDGTLYIHIHSHIHLRTQSYTCTLHHTYICVYMYISIYIYRLDVCKGVGYNSCYVTVASSLRHQPSQSPVLGVASCPCRQPVLTTRATSSYG